MIYAIYNANLNDTNKSKIDYNNIMKFNKIHILFLLIALLFINARALKTDSFTSLQNVIKESCKTLPNVANEFKKITKNKDILNTSCMGTEFHISSEVQQIKCIDVKDANIFMKQRYGYLTKTLKINSTELENIVFSFRDNDHYDLTIDYIQTSPSDSKNTSFLSIYRNFDKKNKCVNIISTSTYSDINKSLNTIKDLKMVSQTELFNFDDNIDILLLNIKNKFKLRDIKSILMLHHLYSIYNIANSILPKIECPSPMKILGC